MSATEAKTVSKSALRKGKPKAGVEGLLRVVEGSPIVMDPSRDSLLTEFGKKTLQDRYLLPGESYQDMFARVSLAFADDTEHAQRLYDYMSKLWFMPATPVLSNGGAARGLPISCFLNQVGDSLDDIVETWTENVWLASNGGGIGTYWGNVRSIGEKVGQNGQTSGIIPFIRVMDSLTLAISQGSLRRGSAACYIDVHHPEIEEFLEIRKASGDFNRKSLNLHHGINITDDFMEAVKNDEDYGLISPKSKEVIRTINARKLWLGLKVTQSNLCSEITLPTGVDHAGQDRTAVCCLSSVNAEKYLEWSKDETFIEDIFRFLDNVLEDFIERAPPEMARAVYSAKRERSVGLGLMGFHSFLQTMNVPLESAMAKVWNEKMFKHIRQGADAASVKLAKERGPCEDARDVGMMARFSHKMAVAPTASISIICGGTSAGIEPIPANVYTHKTLSGSFTVKNQQLQRLLASKDMDTDEVWTSILEHEGSIQHLECLDEHEKSVFKTAFEIDQRWIIELAADRTPYICQSQSLNLFLPGDIAKWDLHMLHWTAWERGLKSLYYCRSKSVQRAAFAGSEKSEVQKMDTPNTDYDECLACQ